MKKSTFTFLLAICLLGCTNKRQLSQQEIDQLANLKVELKAVSDDLADAEVSASQYGGLINTLATLRIQILKTTHALVQERIQAIEAGAPITTIVPVSVPDTQLVRQLEQEVARQTVAVKAAQTSAYEYGGLLGALKKSSLFTEENTLALTKQRLAIARFGLALPSFPQQASESASNLTVPQKLANPATRRPEQIAPKRTFEIVDIDTRVTESNDVWHKYAWKLTLRNQSDDIIACDATIEFLDSDGFVIDDDTEYNLVLNARDTKTFTGYKLVNADVANRVSKVNAKARLR